MPVADGAVFLAPHPGQGELLLACIDPSVADEADPLSVVPELDPFDPANGFAEPPSELVLRRRVPRSLPGRAARSGRPHRRRRAGAPRPHRRGAGGVQGGRGRRRPPTRARARRSSRCSAPTPTRAPSTSRSTPASRPYGSLFGKRPDLIDYGQVGFGRLTTPEAWLSTWSGLSSNADFVRCAPGVTVPTLFVELTGDQAAFPADSRRMVAALGAADLTTVAVRGLHFGGAIADGEPTGNELAAARDRRMAREVRGPRRGRS